MYWKLNGFAVAVVNPRLIKNFSRAMGIRSKTDIQDARVIREYGVRMEPPIRQKCDSELLRLKAMASRRRQLVASPRWKRIVSKRRQIRKSSPIYDVIFIG